jgi:hypothetical protein
MIGSSSATLFDEHRNTPRVAGYELRCDSGPKLLRRAALRSDAANDAIRSSMLMKKTTEIRIGRACKPC